jgi:hypothetical protein
MSDLVEEARNMPKASIRFARDTLYVKPPEHLLPLLDHVREKHGGELSELQEAINERFGTTGARDDYVNVFYAAGELALMERVGRDELTASDRTALRELWETLLAAS